MDSGGCSSDSACCRVPIAGQTICNRLLGSGHSGWLLHWLVSDSEPAIQVAIAALAVPCMQRAQPLQGFAGSPSGGPPPESRSADAAGGPPVTAAAGAGRRRRDGSLTWPRRPRRGPGSEEGNATARREQASIARTGWCRTPSGPPGSADWGYEGGRAERAAPTRTAPGGPAGPRAGKQCCHGLPRDAGQSGMAARRQLGRPATS